jgi:GT2 family glycosyltransferase
MPLFSILVPVHDPPVDLLRACVDSVVGQTFEDWELCLVDDASTDPDVIAELARRSAMDPRIHLWRRPVSGGIVAASNEALRRASGEFVVLVDHDDWIEAIALQLVADAVATDPSTDYLYTDEDKVTSDGTRFDVFHKPDWSPERLRSQNYCTHLSVMRRELVESVGGFRTGFDGSQDHDLILRVTERARAIRHIPAVLYHWCAIPGSAAADANAKPYAREAGRRAVADHVVRCGIDARVVSMPTPGHYQVARRPPAQRRRVSVVIPTAGTVRPVWGVDRVLVLHAVRSLMIATRYDELDVIVVTDPGTDPDVAARLAAMGVRIVEGRGPFNFSRRCNEGVAASTGHVLVLLNDDVLVEQADWLDTMTGFLAEKDVGVVGARLLYADGTLQHGGILLNEQPLHIFHGFAGDDPGPFGLLTVDREVSSVTAACMATTRQLWDELGGFDEDFAVAFNDLDFCLRVRATGRRVVWSAHTTLYHFESQSRGEHVDEHEIELMYSKWARELHQDPYGNRNFAPRQAVWLPAERASGWRALRSSWQRFVTPR